MWILNGTLSAHPPSPFPHHTRPSSRGGAPTAGINPFRHFKLAPFTKPPLLPPPCRGREEGGATGKRKQSPGADALRADALGCETRGREKEWGQGKEQGKAQKRAES